MATDKERKLLLLDRHVGGRRLDETSGRRTQVVMYIFQLSALDTRQPITLSFKYVLLKIIKVTNVVDHVALRAGLRVEKKKKNYKTVCFDL